MVLMESGMREALIRAIERLPEREKLVLSLCYDRELNLREIGAVLDVTESRVCQIRGRPSRACVASCGDCSDARAGRAAARAGMRCDGRRRTRPATAVPPVRADEGGPGHARQSVVQGPMLSVRGMRILSPALRPGAMPALATGKVTSVRWQYTFSGVPPHDLRVYLCNGSRCVLLPAAQGHTEAFRGDAAAQDFTFAFRHPAWRAGARAAGRANQSSSTIADR